jgi:alkaline phosphatase D
MALRPPGLGPLIGHTTHDSCRLWIQASDPEDRSGALASNRRTVGVLGVITTGSDGKDKVFPYYYFRLPRQYDRSGTFQLGFDVALGKFVTDEIDRAQQGTPMKIEADTSYRVRMATLTTDDPAPDAENMSDADLAKLLPPIENIGPMLLELHADECEVTIRTFPHPGPDTGPTPGRRQDKLSFLLGSCRYPGLLWKVKDADRIFGAMVRQFDARNSEPPRFTLMVGDQSYADMLNALPVGRADTYQEFQERYHTAFSSPNMRNLLRTAPSYMILDDHETRTTGPRTG